MRFSLTFSRWKGGGSPVLGSDTVPNGADGAPGSPPDPSTMDNLLVSKPVSIYGTPGATLLVGYNYLGSDPSSVALSSYLWDALSERWILTDSVNLAKDGTARLEIISPGGEPPIPSNSSQGSLELLLIVTDTGGAADGEHVFAMGVDASEG